MELIMTPAQIKFRGFRTDGKGWVEGSYVLDAIGGSRIATVHSSGQGLIFHHIHPSSIGMFTGICDKNGREIFGGDILDDGQVKSYVYYGDYVFVVHIDNYPYLWKANGFYLKQYYEGELLPINPFGQGALYDAEIIGNQWEADNGK